MHLQCSLLSLLLLGLVTLSIVEASGKKKKKGRKGKGRGNSPPSTSPLLHGDLSEARNEVLVPQVSKTADSPFTHSIDSSSPNSSPSSSASEGNVARDVIDALGEKGFKCLNRDLWAKWKDRDDLFDYVVTKEPTFIVGFIKQVEKAKGLQLLHCSSRDLK